MKKNILTACILLVLTLPATLPLFQSNWYYNMHDDMQLIRQLELEKCIKDGQIPCRWAPDLGYEYGYPLFNFYPPFPYFVGQIYRTFKLSYLDTVKATAITQFFAASFAMYLLVFGLTKSRKIGIVGAVLYTYAPYHAVNIYIRGAMNEAWASVFFPLLFYYAREIVQKNQARNILKFALSFMLLTLSHNPMNLAFAPLLGIWTLYWLLQNRSHFITNVSKLALSSAIGIGLSAFYVLPVLLETKYVQIETMFANYYSYFTHFTTLKQLLFNPFWSDGPSQWGPKDGMPFSVGVLHWLLPLVTVILLTIKTIKEKKRFNPQVILLILITLMAFFTAFMTHERSNFIWVLVKTYQKIQFPWRFLNPTMFLFSLAGAISVQVLVQEKSKYSRHIGILILVVLLTSLPYFTPVTSGPVTEQQKFSGQAWINQVTSGIYDYLPKTARIAPQQRAKDLVDLSVPDQTTKLLSFRKGTNWQIGNVDVYKPSAITLATLYFPGTKIYVDDRQVEFYVETEFGRPVINLDSGIHEIKVFVDQTFVQKLSNLITLLTTLALITSYGYYQLKRKSQ